MAREHSEAVFLRQVRPDARVQDRALDQPRNVFVVEPLVRGAFAIPRGADEDRAEVDLGKVQPLFQRVYGTGLFGRAAADLDLAPACLGVQRQQGAFFEDLDPSARVRRVVLMDIEADDFGPAQASV